MTQHHSACSSLRAIVGAITRTKTQRFSGGSSSAAISWEIPITLLAISSAGRFLSIVHTLQSRHVLPWD